MKKLPPLDQSCDYTYDVSAGSAGVSPNSVRVRNAFYRPRRWHRTIRRYPHDVHTLLNLIAAVSALALAGTVAGVTRAHDPWTFLASLGAATFGFSVRYVYRRTFLWRHHRRQRSWERANPRFIMSKVTAKRVLTLESALALEHPGIPAALVYRMRSHLRQMLPTLASTTAELDLLEAQVLDLVSAEVAVLEVTPIEPTLAYQDEIDTVLAQLRTQRDVKVITAQLI